MPSENWVWELEAEARGAAARARGEPAISSAREAEIRAAVEAARKSDDAGDRLEGEVAQVLVNAGVRLTSFQRKIGLNGSDGEIDVETKSTIIEATSQTAGKLPQIRLLLAGGVRNPSAKAVILYAPGYGITAGNAVLSHGAYLARTPQELLDLMRRFEG